MPHGTRMFLDYSPSMNSTKLFFQADKAGFVLGAMLLVTLTGCMGPANGPRGRSAYSARPPVETAVVMQDDYVYYPGYDVYYSSNRRQYLWQEQGAWVSRPAPRSVSINVLLGSPSVKMDFHDSPAQHHAAVVQKYPRNWAPPGSNQAPKENRKDDKRDAHGENNQR